MSRRGIVNMKDSFLSGLIALARQAPSLATLIVVGGLVAWAGWAHIVHAKETEVSTIRTEVTELKREVAQGRLESFEDQLFNSKVALCRSDNPELRQVYARRVASLQAKYRALARQEFALPDCGDL